MIERVLVKHITRPAEAPAADKAVAINAEEPHFRPGPVLTGGDLALAAALAKEKQKPAINYDEAVAEAKTIVTRAERGRMRLGELADQIGKKYGENRLKRFAADIGVAACTLKRSRSVYRAWAEGPKGAAPPLFCVAQELQAHPDRFDIIAAKPNLTAREARRLTRKHAKPEKKVENTATEHLREDQERWFAQLVVLGNKVIEQTKIADEAQISALMQQVHREIFARAPEKLKDIREAGKHLAWMADYGEGRIVVPTGAERPAPQWEKEEQPEPLLQAAE